MKNVKFNYFLFVFFLFPIIFFNCRTVMASPQFGTDSASITNPYMPFKKGERCIHLHQIPVNGKNDYNYRDVIDTEIVDGISCLKIVEVDTTNRWFSIFWAAQDTLGNVYILQFLDTENPGLHFLGKNNAFLYMPANIQIGDTLRGTDVVVEKGASLAQLSTGLGPFSNCIKTVQDDGDYVYYAPGFGNVAKISTDNDRNYELKEKIFLMPGDVNHDNKIGLEEAIHALKTVSE
jgi:hypothetical protein